MSLEKGALRMSYKANTYMTDTMKAEKTKVLQDAIEAILQHPTLDSKAKHRGIYPLKRALDRLAKES